MDENRILWDGVEQDWIRWCWILEDGMGLDEA